MTRRLKLLLPVGLGLSLASPFPVSALAGEVCLRADPGGAFKLPCDGKFRESSYCDGLKNMKIKIGRREWQAWPYQKDKGTLIENISTNKQLVRIRMGKRDIASFYTMIGKSERQCLIRNTLYDTWMMRSCSKKRC